MDIRIDASEVVDLAQAWQAAPDLVAREMSAAVTEAQMLLMHDLKELDQYTPSAFGNLRDSIQADPVRRIGDSILGVVGTSISHALPVELGTKPHFPPVEPLIDWVKQKLDIQDNDEAEGVAWAIATKMATRKTKSEGAHMFQRAFEANTPKILGMYEAATGRIVEGLASG